MNTIKQEFEFFNSIKVTAEHYLFHLGIESTMLIHPSNKESSSQEVPNYERLQLEDITAYIQINGLIQGVFLFTVEDQLAQALAKRYILEKITDNEAAECAIEVVAEIVNIISGNALTERAEHDIFLGNPLLIVSAKAEIRSKNGRLYAQRYITNEGRFLCIYIPTIDCSEFKNMFTEEID